MRMPSQPFGTERAVRIVWAIVALIAAAIFVWVVVSLLQLDDDYDALEQRSDASAADQADLRADLEAQALALEEANRRLVDAGERPVPEPAPGAPGQQGLQGLKGDPGEDGTDGVDGKPGRRGVAGKPGVDGADGRDGVDGVDGKDGAPGADGSPGRDGRDGADGLPGQPGRDAFPFTFRFTVQENPAQSTTYTVTCTVEGCTVTETR